MPSFLGAITLYVLNRRPLLYFLYQRKWTPTVTSLVLLGGNIVALLIPLTALSFYMIPNLLDLATGANELYEGLQIIAEKIYEQTGIHFLSKESLQKISSIIPSITKQLVNYLANIITNLFVLFLLLYFMFQSGLEAEKAIVGYLPLKKKDTLKIIHESKDIVLSHAVGIPIMAVVQGIVAFIGYLIFDVPHASLWGIATGICSVIPLVGTSIVWIPLVAYLYFHQETTLATGLLIYCSVIVLNIDNVLRMILFKVFVNIHPIVTILGVIAGLQLFGFFGLIFGPLLVDLTFQLIKIYQNEYGQIES